MYYMFGHSGQYLKGDGTKGFCGAPDLKRSQWKTKLLFVFVHVLK